MPIDALCPGCQAKLRIGDEYAGQEARCPRCDAIYTVPAATLVADGPPAEEVAIAGDPPPMRADSPASESAADDVVDAVVAEPLPEPARQAELPPPDGTHWFLRTPEGPIYGPASQADFQRWVLEGRVTPDCLVAPGDNAWQPATSLFPELAAPRPQPTLRPETLQALRKQPHRGALILLLGIMGIITTCPIPSVMAWVMGSHDLGEMQAGRMEDAGHGMTTAGRLLGLVFSMVYIVTAVIGMFVLVLVVAR